MPYLKKWAWENIWLIYASFAYLLLPWVFALWTIPSLFDVYSSTPQGRLVLTIVFGLLWGLAVVLAGLGIYMLGLALAYGIIFGLQTSLGSLVPLIGQHRDQLFTRTGLGTIGGIVLLTVAVVLFTLAGRRRERILQERSGGADIDTGLVRKGQFIPGLIVCVLCGVLGPLFNIAFAYASEIQRQAVRYGANPAYSANAVWLLIANVGYLPSLGYVLYLLSKNKTWGRFGSGTMKYWLLTPVMGAMWIVGTVLYGVGAINMGASGPAIGWPVWMSSMVLVATFWGFLTGEWRGIHGKPIRYQMAGLVILIAAMFVLGLTSKV
jgi:L-rhamnose-H+ transport protein